MTWNKYFTVGVIGIISGIVSESANNGVKLTFWHWTGGKIMVDMMSQYRTGGRYISCVPDSVI